MELVEPSNEKSVVANGGANGSTNGVLYQNAKNEPQNSSEGQPKIGFLYTKGGLNTETPYRGPESLRLLTEATESNPSRDEGAGKTNGELFDSFKRLREVVNKAGLNIAAQCVICWEGKSCLYLC